MEAERLNSEVISLEERVAEFKEQHIDELPEMLEVNWQMFDRTDAELKELQRNRRTLEDQRIYLESELAVLNPYDGMYSETGARILSPADRLAMSQSELAQLRVRYSSDHPDVMRLEADVASLEEVVDSRDRQRALHRELESARSELAQIRERYAADHPDIVLLTAQVKALVKALEKQVDTNTRDVEATNPAYIQMESRLKTIELELMSLDTRELEVKAKRAELERRISRTPAIEKDFRELAREYSNASMKYQEVRAKQMEARLAESLEQERKGEKFTLIDPPRVPEKPVSPDRLLIFLVGLVLAIGAGIGMAVLLEAADSRLYSPASIEAVVGQPPSVAIPFVLAPQDIKKARLRLVYLIVAFLVMLGVSVGLFHFFVLPLDAAWAILMKRLFGL